ncbi:MAG: rRNA maturation RNase YbeY [Bacillota bacterium]|nr:rRNA maturation RNase YbeY [Bacillota bacterium]
MQLLISNEQNQVPVGEDLLGLVENALAEVLKEEGFFPEAEVSMVLVDDARMAGLNRKYRGIEGTTDVLAFPMLEEGSGKFTVPDPAEEILLGDIVISVPRALEQAAACGNSLAQEVVFLAVHGMLHLLGYDHGTPGEAARMRGKEKRVLDRLGFEVREDE